MSITKYGNPFAVTRANSPKRKRAESVIIESVGNEIINISVSGDSEICCGMIVDNDEQKQRILIGAQLTSVTRLYGATGEIDGHTLNESINFIFANYCDFSIEEIKFAFEFSATDENGSVALYGKPYNLEWLSRVLRHWKTSRKQIVKTMIARKRANEQRLQASADQRRKQKNEANKDAIRRIVDEYERFCILEYGFVFRVFWFQFLERIEYFSVTTESKNRAMVRAKTETVRRLQSQIEAVENGGETFSVSAISKAARKVIDGDPQKTEAVRRIMTAHFHRLKRRGIDSGEFERMLAKAYEPKAAEMSEPKYRIVVDMKIGRQYVKDGLTKAQAVELKLRHETENAEQIKGVKIEIQ